MIMAVFSLHVLLFLETLVLMSALFLHVLKKNSSAVLLYAFQSVLVAIILFSASGEGLSVWTVGVAVATLAVKAVLAPLFMMRLIRRHRLTFSASTYLSTPVALIVLGGLVSMPFFPGFEPFFRLAPEHGTSLLLAMACMLVSIFLLVNRKGALSQIIGILSLENAIVSFAAFAGLESTVGPQIGILFDLCVWIVIATVFASMIYRHFGSLDVTVMRTLKED